MISNLKSLTALLMAAAPAITAMPAHAVNHLLDDPTRPCLEWNVDFRNANQGGRELGGNQANGFSTAFYLEQSGTRITGRGTYMSGRFHSKMRGDGTVTGTLRGSALEIETSWGGVYWGLIDSSGMIKGITHPKGSARWFDWTTTGPVECLKRGPATNQVKQPLSTRPQPIAVPAGLSDPTAAQAGTGGSRASSVFGPRPARAPAPVPAPTPVPALGSISSTPGLYCKVGYVWRVARPADLVCVTPASRATVANENFMAGSRIGRERGSYGRNTCKVGFVWREAFVGDVACVTPERRTLVAIENRIGPSLRAP